MNKSNKPELPTDSFLASLLIVLEQQDPALQSEFFINSKEELIQAFSEGSQAAAKQYPQSANPYEESSDTAYSQQLAWNEGWMYTQLSSGKLLKGF